MRQRNFLVGLVFAVLTFAALTSAFGWRHHHWHRGWHDRECYAGWHRGHHHDEAPQQREGDNSNQQQIE